MKWKQDKVHTLHLLYVYLQTRRGAALEDRLKCLCGFLWTAQGQQPPNRGYIQSKVSPHFKHSTAPSARRIPKNACYRQRNTPFLSFLFLINVECVCGGVSSEKLLFLFQFNFYSGLCLNINLEYWENIINVLSLKFFRHWISFLIFPLKTFNFA